MSLSAISTSGIIMGSGSVAMSGELYVRASHTSGGIPAATVSVWSTPAEISVGNIENYATTGNKIRLSTSVATGCSLGGIDAYGYYADKLLVNVHPSGSGSIILKHESADSLEYNRFSLPGGSGIGIHPYLSSSGCMLRVIYDPIGSRWLACIPLWYGRESEPTVSYWTGAVNDGSWTSVGNFSADLAGSVPWVGSLIDVWFNSSSVVGTVSSNLGANQSIYTLTFGSTSTSQVSIGGGGNFTLTISPDSSLQGVTVQNSSYNYHIISANVILGAEQTWKVTNSSQTLVANGVIGGNFGLTKEGGGTLILSGDNTFVGTTTVSSGILLIGNTKALGDVFNPLILNGSGTLNLYGISIDIGPLSGSSGVIKNSIADTHPILGVNSTSDSTFFGVIQSGVGGVRLHKNGSGVLTLGGTSSHTGLTTVNNGTLIVNGLIDTNVSMKSGAFLGGTGQIGDILHGSERGRLYGSGTISPGGISGVPGVLSAYSFNPDYLNAAFEFTYDGEPDFSQPTNSLNDVLVLRASGVADPFAVGNLSESNIVDIYLNVDSLEVESKFWGGWFIRYGSGEGWFSSEYELYDVVVNATYNYWKKYTGSGSGVRIFNNINYNPFPRANNSMFCDPLGGVVNPGTVGSYNGFITTFTIPAFVQPMVPVCNTGNAADTTDYGSVSYCYNISQFEVTGLQYTEFLNAVAFTDNYGLYNENMGTDAAGAQIIRSGSPGNYTYSCVYEQRPITYVSWFDCARFCNWIENGMAPEGDTETGAYTLPNGQISGGAPAANNGAIFRMPTENEWYKAAYYSPNKGGEGVGGYYLYATQSDTLPGQAANSEYYSTPNLAHYISGGSTVNVALLPYSKSFYTTYDQSGNVYEWNDTDNTPGGRCVRGGAWNDTSTLFISSAARYVDNPANEYAMVGFRLAGDLLPALIPKFGTPNSTPDGFTVQITNYDNTYTWTGTATASGSVEISGTGLVTVTGVNPYSETSSTVTITTTKTSSPFGPTTHKTGSATVSAPTLSFTSSLFFAAVGNAGNIADPATGDLYGAVSYAYQIGRYEVTGFQYVSFLNAKAQTDPYGLYSESCMNPSDSEAAAGAEISRSGSSGSYTYSVVNESWTSGGNAGYRPITCVSWFSCARFCNWLVNGGGNGSTEYGAYALNGQVSGNPPAANANAIARMPTENEWYKAAYYSPNKGGVGVGGYYLYATQNDVAPCNGSFNTFDVPDPCACCPTNTAHQNMNYYYFNGVLRAVVATPVGYFSNTKSFYGTFDQNGNASEWNDLDGTSSANRGARGGNWLTDAYTSGNRGEGSTSGSVLLGFRLATRDIAQVFIPLFSTPARTADGFTVQIKNYDAVRTWTGTASAGSVAISVTNVSLYPSLFKGVMSLNGLVTVTGVAPETSSTATITASGVSATVTGTSLAAALNPTFGTPTRTANGFTSSITNYDDTYTWAGTATLGKVVISDTGSGTGLVTVTGVAVGKSSTATITTSKSNTVGGTANVTETSLLAARNPTFGSTTPTADGFTVVISNYSSVYTWAGTATASGTVVITDTGSGTGLATVTGVAAATSSTATITTTRAGYASGSRTITQASL